MIGTLIETNERIIAALEMYDTTVSSKVRSLLLCRALQNYIRTSYPSPLGRRKMLRAFRKALPRPRSTVPNS